MKSCKHWTSFLCLRMQRKYFNSQTKQSQKETKALSFMRISEDTVVLFG